MPDDVAFRVAEFIVAPRIAPKPVPKMRRQRLARKGQRMKYISDDDEEVYEEDGYEEDGYDFW